MAKHTITHDDLINNPDLAKWGFKVGHEIEIPDNQTISDEDTDPPGGIEIPKKPPPIP